MRAAQPRKRPGDTGANDALALILLTLDFTVHGLCTQKRSPRMGEPEPCAALDSTQRSVKTHGRADWDGRGSSARAICSFGVQRQTPTSKNRVQSHSGLERRKIKRRATRLHPVTQITQKPPKEATPTSHSSRPSLVFSFWGCIFFWLKAWRSEHRLSYVDLHTSLCP